MFPQDASAHGHRIDELFYVALWLTTPAFLAVVAILAACLVKFRAREGHRAAYFDGSSKKALWGTLAFSALVFVGIDVNLAVRDEAAFRELFEAKPGEDPLVVRVMGEQFLWSFRLPGADGVFDTPDDVMTTGEVHVPTGRPLLFELRSRDVIHSFCLPNLRVKQDLLPGMTTRLRTEAKVPGRYEIMCAQLCGFGHYAMRGTIVIDEPRDFERWQLERNTEFGVVRSN